MCRRRECFGATPVGVRIFDGFLADCAPAPPAVEDGGLGGRMRLLRSMKASEARTEPQPLRRPATPLWMRPQYRDSVSRLAASTSCSLGVEGDLGQVGPVGDHGDGRLSHPYSEND
jgi:hypothetical protein